MFTELNQKLEEAQQGIYRLHKVDAMLGELQGEKQSLEQKLFQLKSILEKENLDVEKLENQSLASVLYSLLGSLEERLEKEKGEALAVKLKYDQAVHDLEMIENEIENLTRERQKFLDCPALYDTLYRQKKEFLMKSNPEVAQRILDKTKDLNDAKNNLKEIAEATSVGKEVVDGFNNTLSSLNSAGNWGTWDLLGGGLITDLAKHSHIDEAKAEIERVQALLHQFKTELADVRIDTDIFIDTDGFVKFADFFFDGLISDWLMQSKIHNSQENVSRVKRQVQKVMDNLERLREQESLKIENLQKELDHLIRKTQ